jgi:hypothetical protein
MNEEKSTYSHIAEIPDGTNEIMMHLTPALSKKTGTLMAQLLDKILWGGYKITVKKTPTYIKLTRPDTAAPDVFMQAIDKNELTQIQKGGVKIELL